MPKCLVFYNSHRCKHLTAVAIIEDKALPGMDLDK